MQYRQGDVFLFRVPELPAGAIEHEMGAEERIVLAYGEVTGHAHALSRTGARLYHADNERFVMVAQRALLIHEEHAPIPLGPGVYKVVQQREYVPQAVPTYVSD